MWWCSITAPASPTEPPTRCATIPTSSVPISARTRTSPCPPSSPTIWGKPMLKVEGLCSGYGRIRVLEDVELEVAEGEIVTLIGANGAGKTTLLMTLCGKPAASAGSIAFEGRGLIGLPTYQIIRRGI